MLKIFANLYSDSMFTSKLDSFLLSFIKDFFMKTSLIIALCFLCVVASCFSKSNEMNHTVNAVLGDISFIEKYGKHPSKNVPEKVRLQTHLQYVEKQLRNKDLSSLSNEQKKNRTKLLDILNEYWKAGIFPKNYDYADQRIPCFIDKDGNICAVGYLIERSAGRKVAEAINQKYKYEYVLAMDDPTVDEWILSSGLSKEECAMIQPSYPWHNTGSQVDNYISSTYGVSSAVLSGVNLSINTLNGIQIANGNKNEIISTIGLVSGTIQLVSGIINYPETYWTMNGPGSNQSQRDLSLVNIGLGTTTLILSTWNVFTNRKIEENQSTSWNLYSFPTRENTTGVGLSFSKRLE